MKSIRYTYCDANVFLAYFNAEPSRIVVLDQLFEEIQRDSERKIVTSVLSITEVSYVVQERQRRQLDEAVHEKFEQFWGDTSLVEFVDFSTVLARQARDLIRQVIAMNRVLPPNDAIHLVSARFVGVSQCFTYDEKLHSFSDIMGYEILNPYISSPRLPMTFDDSSDA